MPPPDPRVSPRPGGPPISEQWPLIKEIFAQAAELSPDAREACIAGRCGGDPDLERQVRRLLASHDSPTTPPRDRAATPAADNAASVFLASRDRIGSYRLLSVLGEGGMGIVYLAEQNRPTRTVALKMIRPGVATPATLERFAHEAEVLGRLQHPGIAHIFEAGTANLGSGPQPYFAMEYIRGRPLLDYCAELQLGSLARLELFARVCDAVQHAHHKGVIHRDLKPGNVLVDNDGQPKVLDFGIARVIDTDERATNVQTNLGQLVGTLPYMSPEQAQGRVEDLDGRTDVYSLGIILYELLAGRPPYDVAGKPMTDAVRIIQQEAPAPLSRISRLFRGDIERIAGKALEKDRTRRYQSAGDLGADILRSLANEPIVARPPTLRYQLGALARRHRAVCVTAVVVVVSLVLGVTGTTWEMIRAYNAEERAQGHARAAALALERAERSEQTEREHAKAAEAATDAARRASLLAKAQMARLSGRPGRRAQALDMLAQAAPIRPDADLRDEAIAALALTDLAVRKEWPVNAAARDVILAFDRSASRYARAQGQGEISICRVDDDVEIAHLPGSGLPAVIIAFSPAGDRIAVKYDDGHDKAFGLWDLLSCTPLARIEHAVDDEAMAFAPSGSFVAAGSVNGDRCVHIYDDHAGGDIKQIEAGMTPHALAISPDSARLAVASGNSNRVDVFEVATGERSLFLTAPGADAFAGVAFDPSSDRIAACCTIDYHVYLWDSRSGQPVATLNGHTAEPRHVSFSDDGRLVATSAWDRTTRLWDPKGGMELLRFSRSGCAFVGPQSLAAIGMQPALLDLVGTKECVALRGHTGAKGPYHLSFSPDNSVLVTSSHDGHRMWDAATGREFAFLPEAESSAAFTADGAALITAARSRVRSRPLAVTDRRVQIGPPQVVSSRAAMDDSTVWFSADGMHTLAHGANGDAVMTHTAQRRDTRIPFEHPFAVPGAVSPDGSWFATYSAVGQATDVCIWDGTTGERIAALDLPGGARPWFGPDGRTLVVLTRDRVRLYTASNWSAAPRALDLATELAAAFSPDSRVLAVAAPGSLVRLVDTETLNILATLTPPDDLGVMALAFSPDGSRIALATPVHLTYVWDLAAIRSTLAAMGLDWASPPLPARTAGSAPASVEFVE